MDLCKKIFTCVNTKSKEENKDDKTAINKNSSISTDVKTNQPTFSKSDELANKDKPLFSRSNALVPVPDNGKQQLGYYGLDVVRHPDGSIDMKNSTFELKFIPIERSPNGDQLIEISPNGNKLIERPTVSEQLIRRQPNREQLIKRQPNGEQLIEAANETEKASESNVEKSSNSNELIEAANEIEKATESNVERSPKSEQSNEAANEIEKVTESNIERSPKKDRITVMSNRENKIAPELLSVVKKSIESQKEHLPPFIRKNGKAVGIKDQFVASPKDIETRVVVINNYGDI